MTKVVLYTREGASSIFLGEVELGEEEYTMPVMIYGLNQTAHKLRKLRVSVEGPAAEYVQLSEDGSTWLDLFSIPSLEPAGEFEFFARALAPSEDQPPGSFKFDFVVRSEEIA